MKGDEEIESDYGDELVDSVPEFDLRPCQPPTHVIAAAKFYSLTADGACDD